MEWVTFAKVARVPRAGEIVHAEEPFEEPAGGGAVAAVQLARLAGTCTLVTALGEDEHGRKAVARLEELGVEVKAAWRRTEPTRTAVTLLDGDGERTIVTLGPRLEPTGADKELEWAELAKMDGVYFTAGDLEALKEARAAKILVASPRAIDALGKGVALDGLVLSEDDALERAEAAEAGAEAKTTGAEAKTTGARAKTAGARARTGLVVRTEGAKGGVYETGTGETGRWRPAQVPGEAVDSYGCGDSFAAGLTYGLGAGMARRAALELAARCGAVCLTGRGPYEAQLSAADIADA